MADFDGLDLDIFVFPDPCIGPTAIKNEESITDAITRFDLVTGDIEKQTRADTTKQISGVFGSFSTFDQVALRHVYVLPEKIDAGFIVEDENFDITVWNSSDTPRTVDSILKQDDTGTLLQHEVTPFSLPGDCSKIHTVTVFEDGPPFQQTVFTYTVGSDVYTVTLTGQRVEPFVFDPDWRGTYRYTPRYKTAISISKRFVEQRRALQELPRRKIEAEFWEQSTDMQRLYNFLKKVNDLVMAIPIFHEFLAMSNLVIQGETILTFSTDFVDYTNLVDFSTFLILKDVDNPHALNEVKEIASLDTGAKTITLKNSVQKDFVAGNTDVYPVMLGTIRAEGFEHDHETSNLITMGLNLEELRLA